MTNEFELCAVARTPDHAFAIEARPAKRAWMARIAALAIAAASLSSLGCGARWRVVSQTNPDPFVGATRFAVAPIDFSGLYVGRKSEGEYLSEKTPEQRASFAADKDAMTEMFGRKLAARSAELGLELGPAAAMTDAPFVIQAAVSDLEPGFYVGVASAPSTVQMVVRITTPDGRILDEIATQHSTSAGITTAASGTRLRRDGEALGAITAEYLKTRVAPGS